MRFAAGERLGPYEITGLIGKGGMGEVYRGTDTRLGRPVAIKVSSREFNDRFEREARAISALNHPNICTLHDIGPNYLVMEFIEGDTLSKLIERGPLPLDKALGHAVQIVDALAAAHAKGIIHRDLKPGNIIITRNGVKVLDFGLAKLSSDKPVDGTTSNIETVTEPITRAGAVLGTLYYMAPEQVEGKEADERSDIFSFGVVFYEMITGQRPFTGDTQAAVLAAILKDQPAPLNQRQPAIPRALERVVRRCLEKKPEDRWHTAHDLKPALELIDLEAPPSIASTSSVPIAVQPSRKRWLWPSVGAAALLIAVAAWRLWPTGSVGPAVRFEIPPSDKQTLIVGAFPKVSPNGRWVVFPATGADNVTRMWIRALDSLEVRPLPGTETPNVLAPPVIWSPDSRFIAFSSTPVFNAPGQLKKLEISGGPPQRICDVAGAALGTWGRDGVIVFGQNGMMRVSADGGVPTPVTALDPARDEPFHMSPEFLPDGHHFLYFRLSRGHPEYTGVYVGSIDVKPEQQSAKPLLISDRQASYAPSQNGGPGYLLFLRDTTLFAQPFDPKRLELSGDAVPVADQVGSFPGANAGLFSASETGVLAYRVGTGSTGTQLAWVDPKGTITSVVGDKGAYSNPAISPEGTRIAYSQFDSQNGKSNIWVLDTVRATNTRLTLNSGRDDNPVWSPDGRSIAFASNRAGHFDLYRKPADGGEETPLLKSDQDKFPTSWSRDGHFLLFTKVDPKTHEDVWVLPLDGSSPPKPAFPPTAFAEQGGRFSPDGRWIVYSSNESGKFEIYVWPFSPNATSESAAGAKVTVSNGGGFYERWRSDGKELFYVGGNGGSQQMAVDVTPGKAFEFGMRRAVFPITFLYASPPDVTPDGKQFLYVASGDTKQTPMNVVLNWQAGLKR